MARCFLQGFSILLIHLWLSSQITSVKTEENVVCIASIRVTRNTVRIVSEMNTLKINCTIESDPHCRKNVSATWCKLNNKSECTPLTYSNYTTTELKDVSEIKTLLFLIFNNVSMQDSGLYRCQLKSPVSTVSHSINVTVTDYVPEIKPNNTVMSRGNNTIDSENGGANTWLEYNVYIYSGIGLMLVILIVVCVIVIRCRGQKNSFTEKIHENQSIATPVADLPPPTYKSRESPRIKAQTLPSQPPPVYDIPPVRVRSLRDHSPAGRHAVSRGAPRQYHGRGTVEEIEEDNPLIYASLNHKAMPPRPPRLAHLQIEASEYAAIKVT